MNTAHRDHLEEIDQPKVHHEESDVDIRGIFRFGAALLLTVVVVQAVIWGLFGYFDRRETARGGPASPLVTPEARLPPEPRLQVAPRQDAEQFRAAEDAVLNGYTWVDREAGLVRIPIAEAMKLTLQKGLPTRPAREPGGEPQK